MKKSQKSLRNLGFTSLLLIIAFGCNGKKESNEPDVDLVKADTVKPVSNTRLLIIPGQSIGNISLELNAENIENILGKADLSDAAMGKAWLTWFSKVSDSVTGNELNIYTEYKDNEMTEKVVRQIRITSDEFKTAEGIGTGKSIDAISKIFPSIKMVGKYDTETNFPVTLYDAVDDGIAFEAENNVCTGIIIHQKGRSVSEVYISFHPDMKPM
ncbi:MAG: hypothetical protein EOO48_06950 [Flavobacterium sp.]|nr:MAG: hypothetical protein EOO48_06950 [Flavobacterium sp.]